MKQRITKRAIDSLKSNGRTVFVWDTDVTGFGCKATPTGGKVYLFQYRPKGQGAGNRERTSPKRITLGKHGDLTPDQARTLAASLLLEVKAGQDPRAKWQQQADAPTVEVLCRRFLTEYLPTKKRPPRASTVTEYERLVKKYVLPKLGRQAIATLTYGDLERFHTSMRATPYQANRVLSVLRQALSQAEVWGWLPTGTNPTSGIERFPERERGAAKAVMLSPAQIKCLLASIETAQHEGKDPYACAAILLIFWTGWRKNEVLHLRWDDLDLETGQARLRNTKTRDEEYRHLPQPAIDILAALPRLDGNPWVFPGRKTGQRLTTVRGLWEHIRKEAGLHQLDGLGAFRLHDLRHNVVSWDVSRGVSLEIAGRNVGHRSRRSTEIYAHFAPTVLKQAADARANAMRAAAENEG